MYTLQSGDTIAHTMKWKILPQKSNDLTEQLLINRSIKDRENFFHPKLSDFEKDLEIPGIKIAQKRILQAIENNEQILVYGDYDVDGITACAILYKALTSVGAKVLPYIPHREKEGYGLSKFGLDLAKESGTSLVITVDNGIVAIEQADYAKKIGLDLIITDHHLPLDKKPEAFSIVHSTKMCGAAVGWCLIKDLVSKSLAQELLEFVAIATVCDLIPLINLGRAFLVEGLKHLNKTTNLGLLSLINECNLRVGNIGSYEIGHIIGPRLNAIGRLEHAIDALRLLCTKDVIKAKNLARLLTQTNTTRQQMTTDAIEQARLLVDKEKKIHILTSHDWSPGIIGLVAGRVCEEYSRPVIAISVGEEMSKGSARSVNGINIVEVIRKCSDFLVDVGGHPGAAGFSIKTKNIEKFKKRLEEMVITLPDDVQSVLEIEAEIEGKKLNKNLLEDLEKFEPFGFGNPRPILATYNMEASDIRTVGNGKHLKFKANNIDAIAFGMGNLIDILQNGQLISLAFTPELDTYNGFEKLQLKVKDIRIV